MSYKEALDRLVKIIISERDYCIDQIQYLNRQQSLNESELTSLIESIAIRNELNAIIKKAGLIGGII